MAFAERKDLILFRFDYKEFSAIIVFFLIGTLISNSQINFSQSELNFNGNGDVSGGVTSLMYGPDGRLFVAEYPGTIKIFTIQRNSSTDYVVSSVETLSGVTDIVNHDDDGSVNNGQTQRETTGLTVAGTAANPIIYVASSDFRIGAGSGGGNGDVDLDTNSGIITRFFWNGSSWDVVDLVRGLPRSEENHATNGLEFVTINGTDYLIVASGGITNGGAPSTNFVYTCEYALSGAVLSVNLDMLNGLGVQTDGNGRNFIYDIPTVDDPTRSNVNGITDPNTTGYNGVDVNDPWGGNDGLNQAMVVSGGPVQIFSPGYRNAYDLVVTETGALYVTDNGANGGWGGFPENEGGGSVTNDYNPLEPGSQSSSGEEQINNVDHLQLVTTDLQNYSFGSLYGGHPNPTRANPFGAGLYTAPAQNGTTGAVFRTLTYDPDGSTPGSTTNANIALPANWPPVQVANSVEGDWRGPGINNPDGPDDNPVVTWGTNTNGIDEYTASNFSGAMQGDLLAGHNNGIIRRVQLNTNGSLQQLTSSFLSGIGGNALGVSCNSDTDTFPGTVWTGTLNGKIVVFEPQDFVTCINPGETGYDANADYDSDGYTNQDEEDNGTDPCNGGSQPDDFDKSAGAPLISDLNDTDDDADSISDANDPFQLGDPNTAGSDAFTLPISNDLFNDQQGLGGIFGLGLTGLMNNGDTSANWLDWLDDRGQGPNPDDVLGGATGLMTSHMTSGTALGATNTQEKGYQYGVQVDQNTGKFTVIGNLINFTGPLRLYGNTSAIGGELGHFIGDGTQSNYIKIVITTAGLTALQEINDVPQTPINVPIAVQDRPTSDIVFYFVVDPSNGQVDLEYAIDGGARTVIGTIIAQGSILTAIQQSSTELAVGFIGTSNTTGVELEGTWDFLSVIPDANNFAILINSGGPLTIQSGKTFSADQYFSGGQAYSNTSAQVPELYQTERSSPSQTFAYNIPVTNGDYTVILHFAEIYWGATGGGPGGIGQRIFDVSIEGSLVLDNYDINADVGPETIVTKSFDINVTDGTLNLDFSALAGIGGVDQPKISAIEIIGENSQFPPIIIDPIADQISQVGDISNLIVTVSGGDPVNNFTFSISGQPEGIQIDPINGILFGTTTVGAATGGPNGDGVHNVNVLVDKPGSTTTSVSFTWTVSSNPFALRINAGGPDITNNGLVFSADDQYFSGGQAYSNTSAQVPELYQTERSSQSQTFAYNIPVTNGDYTVILHFAEIYWGATGGGPGGIGQRIFDVSIEGSLVLDNYDINADVGPETIVTKSFDINVTDGTLNLDFSALAGVGGVDQPKLSAIEVLANNSQFPALNIEPIADQNNDIGETISGLSVTATGGDPNANFVYGILGQPLGISIEPTNGLIYGNVDSNALVGGPNNDGIHLVTVTVNKAGSAPVQVNFTWTITGTLSCTWNDLADANYSRFQSRNELLGDKIYVMGGWLSGINSNTHLEIYDITNDTWAIGADMLLPVTHMGSVVVGNEVWLIGGILGFFTGLTDKVQIYNTLTNTWSYGPDLPKAIGSAAATLNGNKIHYFGGLDPDIQTNIGDHYVLDLDNIAAGWTTAASMTNPRNHHSAETLNGIIYAIGGQLGHITSKQDVTWVDAYDPTTDSWTSVADLPLARSHFESGTTVHNGKIIIVGGQEETTNYSDDITQYDPVTNQWAELCTLPNNRLSPMAQVYGDKLIVSGGGINGASNLIPTTQWLQLETQTAPNDWVDKDENENYTGRHECNFVQVGNKFYLLGGRESDLVQNYDYLSDTWITQSSAPKLFSHFQAIEYQGLIWVIGAIEGDNYPYDTPNNYIWIFNPLTDEWIQGPEIPSQRVRGSTGAVLYNDKFYIVGGNTNGHAGGYVNWFDEYDPATGNWTTLPNAPTARDHFHAVLIGDELYAVGGRQTGDPGDTNQTALELGKPLVAEVDVYDFSTGLWRTLPSGENLPTPRAGAAAVNFNNKLVVIGGEVYQEIIDNVITTGALKVTEEYDPITGSWNRLSDLNHQRHGHQALVSGNGIHVIAGSPNYGGGIQKNMEYYGVDSPLGSSITGSELSAPSIVLFDDGSTKDVSLDVVNGDIGIWIRSMVITGTNASDFNIQSGYLENALMKANSSQMLTIEVIGTAVGRNATLTINYGVSSTLDIDLVEPLSCTWNDLADANYSRFQSRNELLGDKIYVMGGWLSGINSNTHLEIYDITNDTWAIGADMLLPVTHMGSVVVGNEVWLIGGILGFFTGLTDKVQIYNTLTNTWSYGPDLPKAIGSAAATLNGNKIHYFGGLDPDIQTNIGDHYVLDLDNIAAGWTTAASMTNPRNHHSAETLNGIIYAIGGQLGHITSKQDVTWVDAYDPTTDSWTSVADLPLARSHFESGTTVHNGKIIIVGGQEETTNYSDDITQYDPVTNQWAELCTLPNNRLSPMAQVYGDKLIVSGGGINGASNLIPTTQWLQLETQTGGTEYSLTVESGNGDGSYVSGSVVDIIADLAPSGQEFDIWTGDVTSLADVNSASTIITMPSSDVSVTATYRAIQTTGTVWLEDFEGLTNGTTVDNGATAWTSIRDSGTFEVSNGQFLTNGNSTNPGVWTSEVIPINGTVSLSIDVDDANNNKEPADFVRAYYVLDGGPQVEFGSVTGDISSQTFTVSNISGSTLQIIVESDVSTINEFYYIDNVTVFGEPTGATEYNLLVVNGNGDGLYQAGTQVDITADAAPSGQEFDLWTGDVTSLADVNSASTIITMPSSDVSVTATYRAIQTTGTVWLEDFEGLTNGTTVDNGATAWTSIRDSGTFEVSNGQFLTNGNSTNPGVWTSEVIPINGTVSLSIDVDDANNNKEPADFVRAYYVLDGGPQVEFGSVTGDISAQTFTVSNISGSTLQIIVESDVSTINEFYYIDNVTVFGEPTGATEYNLLVVNGNGDGLYQAGTQVDITADAAPSGQEFDLWTGDVTSLADVNSASTIITMPSSDVSVTATYRAIQTTGTVWLEDFEGLTNGTTVDNGATAWTSIRDSGTFEVSNGQFLTNGNSTNPGVWTSEVIPINGTVSLSIDVDDANNNKEPADFVRAYYVLDGGPQVEFGSVTGDISAQTFTVSNISGSTLQIIVESDVSTINEFYYIDNITVIGNTNNQNTAKNTSLSKDTLSEGIPDNNDELTNYDIEIFPNPTSNETQISIINQNTELSKIYIYDLSGRLIKTFEATNLKIAEGLYMFNVSDFEDGVYFVNLRTNGINLFGYKLVIKK